MPSDLQARLEQAHGKRMSDAAFAKIYPLACEFLSAGSGVSEPLIMLELKRARAAEAALLREVLALRRVRDAIGGVLQAPLASVHHSGAVDRLNAACAEADAARTP